MTVERLIRFGEAWSRGDIDELMSYMADDCVYGASVGPEPGLTFYGREAVRRGFAQMLAFDKAGRSKEGPVSTNGKHGTAEWSYISIQSDGTHVEVRGCDLFEFRGDLIVKKDAFRKTSALLPRTAKPSRDRHRLNNPQQAQGLNPPILDRDVARDQRACVKSGSRKA